MKTSSRQSGISDYKVISSLVIFAIVTRIALPPLIGHPSNFSPIDAIALFCGAYFDRRVLAILTTLVSVWLGDLLIDKVMLGYWTIGYVGFYWQYAAYLFITLIGFTLSNKVNPFKLLSACLASSVLFFVISNFGVWIGSGLYPITSNGLLACYTAAIPFFKNTAFSDLFFSIVLFRSFEWIKNLTAQSSTLPKHHI